MFQEKESASSKNASRSDQDIFKKMYLLSETDLYQIFQQAKKLNPNLLIIDSIQTIHSQHIESAPDRFHKLKTAQDNYSNMLKNQTFRCF